MYEEVAVLGVELNDAPIVHYRSLADKRVGKIACRVVVDASGQGAVLAKQLGIRIMDDGFRFMSVWGYFNGSKYVGVDGRAHPAQNLGAVKPVTFVTSSGRWGWAWHIILRETTSVGFVLHLDEIKSLKSGGESLEAFFVERCRQTPYVSRLLADATYVKGSMRAIRDYSYRPSRAAGPGWFLVGDAAGFVDPIFSIGVTFAMYTALLAAWGIDRSLRNPARAGENREMFSNQTIGLLEVTRGLALPNYGIGDHSNNAVDRFMRFKSRREKELMFAASTVTARNGDFRAFMEHTDGDAIVSKRYRVLDEIAF